MIQIKPGFRLLPQAHIERLKKVPVLIGHERCASSNFCEQGTLVVCADHAYGEAKSVLHLGRTYQCCPKCIASLPTVWAVTEPNPRGPWVGLEGED